MAAAQEGILSGKLERLVDGRDAGGGPETHGMAAGQGSWRQGRAPARSGAAVHVSSCVEKPKRLTDSRNAGVGPNPRHGCRPGGADGKGELRDGSVRGARRQYRGRGRPSSGRIQWRWSPRWRI